MMSHSNVFLLDEYNDVCEKVAMYIKYRINQHNQNPETKDRPFVLGLPTGSTPKLVYKRLIGYYQAGELSFKNVMTFNMDEYYPIPIPNEQSYNYYMFTHFFSHIDIDITNINLLNGEADDPVAECQRYEELLEKFPVDLFLGGVGVNGHIAFNEPGSDPMSKTRLVDLTESTIDANSRFFKENEEVPKQALTIGLGTLMKAKEIVIMATGVTKAKVVNTFMSNNNYDVDIPITILKGRYQGNWKLFIDFASGSLLTRIQQFDSKYDYTCFDIEGNRISNMLMPFIKTDDRVMFTSPHPDDDVLGCGGTMYRLSKHLDEPTEQVSIVYMTNGTGGLSSGIKGAETLRINEAVNAVSHVGYKPYQVVNGTMPFYRRSDRQITMDDVVEMERILNEKIPNHVFVCCDPDPKGTHTKCLEILQNCDMPQSVKFIWLYKSAWQGFKYNEANIEVVYDDEIMKLKKQAIMSHESQHNLMVNDGETTGLQSIIDGYKKSDKYPDYYTEKFIITTPVEFFRKTIRLSTSSSKSV